MGIVHNLSLYASRTVPCLILLLLLIKLSEYLSGFYVLDIRTFQKMYIILNFVTKSGILFGYQSRHMSGLSIDLLENIHLLTHLWFNLIQRSFLYFSRSRYYCLVCYPKLYTFLWLGSARIGWFSSHVSSHPSQMTNKWHTIRSQQMEKLTRTDVGWPVNSGRILAISRHRLAHEWWGVFNRQVAHEPWKWGLNIMWRFNEALTAKLDRYKRERSQQGFGFAGSKRRQS